MSDVPAVNTPPLPADYNPNAMHDLQFMADRANGGPTATATNRAGNTVPSIQKEAADAQSSINAILSPVSGAVATATVQADIATNAATNAQTGTPNRPAVRLIAISALPAGTYSNGTAGVGATFSITTTGALTIDGKVVALNDDLIITAQGDPTQNGFFRCTTAGASGVAAVLTRRTTENIPSTLGFACALANDGATLAGYGYRVATDPATITIGTTQISVVQAISPLGIAAESISRANADSAINSRTAAVNTRKFSSLVSATADVNGLVVSAKTNGGVDIGLQAASKAILSAKVAPLVSRKFSSLSMALMDNNGAVYDAQTNGGLSIGLPAALNARANVGQFSQIVATIQGIFGYGQSLSIGTTATAALTNSQPGSNVMFSSGLLQIPGNTGAQTAFSPAVEATTTLASINYGETGWAAMANTVSALQPNRASYFVGAFGLGGNTIAQLSKGGAPYTALLAAIQNAFNIATAAGDVFEVPYIPFVQGEQDENQLTASGTYTGQMVQLAINLDADIRAITGQKRRVLLAVSQPSDFTEYGTGTATCVIPIAQLNAMLMLPSLIRIVGAKYHLSPYTGPHLDAFGYRHLGLDFAKFHMEEIVNGVAWSPLMPIPGLAKHSGKAILAPINVPSGQLIFDTATVTDPNGARGFEVADSGGAAAISAIELVGKNLLHIVCSRALANDGSIRLRGGYSGAAGNSAGPTSGGRICLRDSATLTTPYTGSGGTPYPLYNWCIHFDLGVQ